MNCSTLGKTPKIQGLSKETYLYSFGNIVKRPSERSARTAKARRTAEWIARDIVELSLKLVYLVTRGGSLLTASREL
jgi:hypothetical protein